MRETKEYYASEFLRLSRYKDQFSSIVQAMFSTHGTTAEEVLGGDWLIRAMDTIKNTVMEVYSYDELETLYSMYLDPDFVKIKEKEPYFEELVSGKFQLLFSEELGEA